MNEQQIKLAISVIKNEGYCPSESDGKCWRCCLKNSCGIEGSSYLTVVMMQDLLAKEDPALVMEVLL